MQTKSTSKNESYRWEKYLCLWLTWWKIVSCIIPSKTLDFQSRVDTRIEPYLWKPQSYITYCSDFLFNLSWSLCKTKFSQRSLLFPNMNSSNMWIVVMCSISKRSITIVTLERLFPNINSSNMWIVTIVMLLLWLIDMHRFMRERNPYKCDYCLVLLKSKLGLKLFLQSMKSSSWGKEPFRNKIMVGFKDSTNPPIREFSAECRKINGTFRKINLQPKTKT